jgi:crossover junction endodeoxyribonuclease RuvC
VTTVLGIDCGLGGALAILGDDGVATFDMPTFTVKRGKTMRRELDGQSLHRLIANSGADHCFVEQAQGMPGQSAYATGIFFLTYGFILGILTARNLPYTIVHPRKWKVGLGVPAEKDGARARASQLLPQAADQWPLKKHDGRAEAALIAYWGIIFWGMRSKGFGEAA